MCSRSHLPTTWGGRRGPSWAPRRPRRVGRIALCMPLAEDLRRRRRRAGRAGAATAATPPQPPTDHHPAIAARPAAATRVEPLGDAAHRCAPGDVLVKALLGFLGDPDPLSAGLLAEAGDAPRRGAFLLFGRGAEINLGQR